MKKEKNSNRSIPGLAIHNAEIQVSSEKIRRIRENSGESKDSINRKYVHTKINEYIKEGLSKEEIIDKILEDPIMEEFEYLARQGCISSCVKNWVEHEFRRNEKNSENEMTR